MEHTPEDVQELERLAKAYIAQIGDGLDQKQPRIPGLSLEALLNIAEFAEETVLGLRSHPYSEFRSAAIQTLQKFRDRSKTDLVFAALADESDIVRVDALKALEMFGGKDALERLRPLAEELMQDPYVDPHLRVTIAVLEARVNAWPQLYGLM